MESPKYGRGVVAVMFKGRSKVKTGHPITTTRRPFLTIYADPFLKLSSPNRPASERNRVAARTKSTISHVGWGRRLLSTGGG